ncbi:SpoIIE family protein phosphatase [Desulfohalovibrio reitneri]|uniref:SpoIIE family protein phosphatase n=1 Tax=Desulfohalovibrio reitneri TaxID=1307759 RepID=UPI0004A6CEFF|nr:SpoIIE family protein phosphatase [Desulfohalovibrio reitneri]
MIGRGIAFKLAVLTLLLTSLILAGILGYNYVFSKNIIEDLAEENGENLARATAGRIGEVFSSVRKVVDSVAYTLDEGGVTQTTIRDLGRRVLRDNPEIYGTCVAYAPYAYDPSVKYFAPYQYRTEDGIASSHLGGPDYQYFYMDWYQLPMELEKPVWTEPYFDKGGGQALMTTYAAPFSMDGEEPSGVVTADINLEWLQELVSGVSVYESGFVFLLSRYGAYISHPDQELVMNETVFTRAEALDNPGLLEVGRRMVAGESGFAEVDGLPGRGESFIYYLPLPAEHWSLGVVLPKDELFAGVVKLTREKALLGGLGFVVLAAFMILLAKSITRPLTKLTAATDEIASGNLDLELPDIRSRDEVGALADSFRSMRDSLKRHIADLTETTAAKERIESELRIARDIQMGILPKIFPPFPDLPEFDIYASIEPALEVGGDLYDFFFVDDDHFCFLIGDVSGKGVPAAFFMAVTRTLLTVRAEGMTDPGAVLAMVNDDLAEENESCMFVTLFLGILNIHDGTLRYANAGHNPPLHVKRGGRVDWIPSLREPMAGPLPGLNYSTRTIELAEGDTVFTYTDGVTEAMDSGQGLYTDERLERTVADNAGLGPRQLIAAVDESIKAFTGGVAQSDDITMLAIRYIAREGSKE